MKIINEKGKLFGVINVVDFTFLLVVVLVAGGLFIKIVLPRIQTDSSSSQKSDVYVTVLCRNITREYAESLIVGDKLVAKNAFADGTIESYTIKPGQTFNVNADGIVVEGEHPVFVDLIVVIKGEGNPEDAILRIGTQEMRVGMAVFVKTNKIELSGRIEAISYDDAVSE